MKIHNIWVNSKGTVEGSYKSVPTTNVQSAIDQAATVHPEWTSMVITIVRDTDDTQRDS